MRQNSFLNNSIVYLKGVGPKRAEILRNELNIVSYQELLTHYPFRYVDRSKFYKVNEISSDTAYLQLKGKISGLKTIGHGRAMRLVAYFQDDTGVIELVWFKGLKWIREKLAIDKEYIIFGKPTYFNGKYNFAHPDLETISEYQASASTTLQAVYSSTEKLKSRGLESKGIRKLLYNLVNLPDCHIPEVLPENVMQEYKFIKREEAFRNIHFPENSDILKKAIARLKFEELFFIQLKLLRIKLTRKSEIPGNKFVRVGEFLNQFYHKHLPFKLTEAQKRVIREIREDMGSGKQMNRLLQGDVGSGKTVVAVMSMLIALDNGYQTCLMAPTEILAIQHHESISKLLKGLDIHIELLTGSTKSAARKNILSSLFNGNLQILVGTHALIEDTVQFNKLGLVIIDEQHRFGVEQRAKLWKKNNIPPHVLVMTATPIPRTLAMTFYGDLDYSVIDELPPGRKPVKTVHKYDSDRLRVFGFLKKQIQLGRQIYIVYPLIKESETSI